MKHPVETKAKYALPLIAFIVIATLVALVIYPVVASSPKDLSIALLSLDEGAETPQGEMNIGTTMVEEISSLASDVSSGDTTSENETPIDFLTPSTEGELKKMMEEGEVFAAIIIPSDFTASQIAVQMGNGEVSSLALQINQGKSPAIASTLETMLSSMLSENGVQAEIEYINPIPEGMGEGAIAQQMSYMLTILVTLILSIVLFIATRTPMKTTRKERVLVCTIQLVYAAVLALCIGWFVSFFMTTFAEIAVPFVETLLFIAIASFSLMMLFIGFFNWHFALGICAIIVVIVCGITTALLPYELLPDFWASWLYPWVPERFVADGLRQVLYLGTSAWNSASTVLLGIGVVGTALSFLTLIRPSNEEKEND